MASSHFPCAKLVAGVEEIGKFRHLGCIHKHRYVFSVDLDFLFVDIFLRNTLSKEFLELLIPFAAGILAEVDEYQARKSQSIVTTYYHSYAVLKSYPKVLEALRRFLGHSLVVNIIGVEVEIVSEGVDLVDVQAHLVVA